MKRITPILFAASLLLLPLSACEKTESTSPDDAAAADAGPEQGEGKQGSMHQDFEGREVVDNWKAEPGDVTTCPFSGKKFEVKDDSPHFEYEGQSFVFCCSKCLSKVEADPEQYLGELAAEANAAEEVDAPAEDAEAEAEAEADPEAE